MGKKVKSTILGTVILLSVSTAFAAERRVPSQYPTIQAAIDDCSNGDVVVILPGTYRGSGNREINFGGKAITVRSRDPDNIRIVERTVVDCEIAGRGFKFCTGEDGNSVIAGLTIVNGHSLAGGAIYCCNKSSPTISSCVMIGNTAVVGGGVACNDGSCPEIRNCTISSNSASMFGGAIYCNAGRPIISNCIFGNNIAPAGGAISCAASNFVVRNCTFSDNRSARGGGIYCYKSSDVTLENSILWGDESKKTPKILVGKSDGVSSLSVLYCDVQGGESAAVVEEGCILRWGKGNLDSEPMFVGGVLGDYYLDQNSPCVDAGSELAADLYFEEFSTRPDGLSESGIIDMGYHYPAEAEAVAAAIDIKPDVFYLDSTAQWITCSIELPEDHNVGDIDSNSIVLEYIIEADRAWTNEVRGVVTAEFTWSKMQGIIEFERGEMVLAVSGKLMDGGVFEGADVIRVMD